MCTYRPTACFFSKSFGWLSLSYPYAVAITDLRPVFFSKSFGWLSLSCPYPVALTDLRPVFLAKALGGCGCGWAIQPKGLKVQQRKGSSLGRGGPSHRSLKGCNCKWRAPRVKASMILAALQAARPYSPLPRAVPLRCCNYRPAACFFSKSFEWLWLCLGNSAQRAESATA